MPSPADEPMTRHDMYFYDRDWSWFARRHGHGISAAIRAVLRAHIRDIDDIQEIDMKVIGAKE